VGDALAVLDYSSDHSQDSFWLPGWFEHRCRWKLSGVCGLEYRKDLSKLISAGWRLPYMVQWVWPVPLFLFALFGPESE
jgi:hypothetical protein